MLSLAGRYDTAVLVSGDDFVNGLGGGLMNLTGGGRWLIYSEDPALRVEVSAIEKTGLL